MKEKCNCGHNPIIILPGINHSPTHLYDSNGNRAKDEKGHEIGGTLFFVNSDEVKKMLPKIIGRGVGSILTQQDCGFAKTIYDAACTAFSYQKCNSNGDFVENLKTERWNYSMAEMDEDRVGWVYRMVPMKNLVDVIGRDHAYFFTFNLVGDPMDSARELNDYIQMVKEQTGHEKVILLPVSLGGTILTAYMDSYGKANGYADIDMIVNAVACLNGTDIAGDIYERKFNITDRFLHHEFIPNTMKEINGDAKTGYIINCLLHLLPQKSFDSIFTGVVSGVIDTIMSNCPQVYAMVPSYRYDAIAQRYLLSPEKARLKERADRFQQARLNLNANLIDAEKTGVKINSISGSNIGFGDIEYSFFGGVASAKDHNTDGIINLSSTTLGATGAKVGTTLPEDYEQKEHREHNYISPDRKIDASTALFPEHTWIFLNQHHEVGNNDIVLNLAKSIILGEVSSVHDNPEKYPQFNGSAHTSHLRRWRIPDGEKALADIKAGTLKCSEALAKELENAVETGKAIITSTIADWDKAKAAKDNLETILAGLNRFTPPKLPTAKEIASELKAEKASEFLLKKLGGGSLADKLLRRTIKR